MTLCMLVRFKITTQNSYKQIRMTSQDVHRDGCAYMSIAGGALCQNRMLARVFALQHDAHTHKKTLTSRAPA